MERAGPHSSPLLNSTGARQWPEWPRGWTVRNTERARAERNVFTLPPPTGPAQRVTVSGGGGSISVGGGAVRGISTNNTGGASITVNGRVLTLSRLTSTAIPGVVGPTSSSPVTRGESTGTLFHRAVRGSTASDDSLEDDDEAFRRTSSTSGVGMDGGAGARRTSSAWRPGRIEVRGVHTLG